MNELFSLPCVALPTVTSVLALFVPGVVEAFLVLALFVLILIDLITGVTASWRKKRPITSHLLGKTGDKTLGYFACYIVVKIVALITVLYLGTAAGVGAAIVGFVLAFFAMRESFSILENIKCLGVKLPPKLVKIMHGIEDQISDDNSRVQDESLDESKRNNN